MEVRKAAATAIGAATKTSPMLARVGMDYLKEALRDEAFEVRAAAVTAIGESV